jgi:predicted peptidase
MTQTFALKEIGIMKKTTQRLATTFVCQTDLDYLLYHPQKETAGPPPLLLFLHGMGERGHDLSLVKKHGPPRVIEGGTELPFVIAAPQCAEGAVWQPHSLLALVDDLLERYDLDSRRVYVTGLSMGGSGTWALANAHPDRFAAIAPICGPFTMVDPTGFTNLPIWCFHGAMDETVPVTDSLRMVGWLRNSGSDVRFTVYPDAGHDSWTEAYAGSELYEWLLTHKKP